MQLNASRRGGGGFSIIELVIVVAVIAVVSAAAVPAIGGWTANARVRSVAESLQNDLRLAQAEAMRRNRQTVFALTSTTPDWNTTPAANGKNWYVRAQPLTNSSETASKALSLVTVDTSAAQAGVSITGPALLCFNSMGQIIAVDSASTGLSTACSATSPTTYTISRAGADRSLKVLVYLGGRVFMCDASKTLSSTDPDGCPAS